MKKFISVTFIAILLLTMMPSVVTAPAKAAAKTIKITWNYNGGKIGKDTKTTTTVKKGAKISKLPKTPTYKGYTFKGWYTKKTGGTKVTVSTKPAKDMTYYAQWKNGSVTPAPTVKPTPVPSNIPTLIGNWKYDVGNLHYYRFEEDGSFYYYQRIGSSLSTVNGKYTASNDKVSLFALVDDIGTKLNDQIYEYSLGYDNEGEYLFIQQLTNGAVLNKMMFRRP